MRRFQISVLISALLLSLLMTSCDETQNLTDGAPSAGEIGSENVSLKDNESIELSFAASEEEISIEHFETEEDESLVALPEIPLD